MTMMKVLAVVVCAAAISFGVRAGEEKIRGLLEKTVKPDACAQITDALNEMYYVAKTDATEKMVAEFLGKNQKVVVTGTVESKPNESVPFINAKTVEAYAPKLPAAPVAPPAPVEKKDEKKSDEKKPEEKAQDTKK